MKQYGWAKNEIKLQRARALKSTGTEAEIKEIYITLGGAVVAGYELPSDEPAEIVEETPTLLVTRNKKLIKVAKKILKNAK